MTTSIRPATSVLPSRPTLRSVGAIVAALLANIILSFIVDEIFHLLGVFPPWGEVSYATVPFALALSYRIVFGVLSGYIAARLAPWAPMRHASILGVVGIALSTAGAIVAIGRGGTRTREASGDEGNGDSNWQSEVVEEVAARGAGERRLRHGCNR